MTQAVGAQGGHISGGFRWQGSKQAIAYHVGETESGLGYTEGNLKTVKFKLIEL
jgi:hypothetical protein